MMIHACPIRNIAFCRGLQRRAMTDTSLARRFRNVEMTFTMTGVGAPNIQSRMKSDDQNKEHHSNQSRFGETQISFLAMKIDHWITKQRESGGRLFFFALGVVCVLTIDNFAVDCGARPNTTMEGIWGPSKVSRDATAFAVSPSVQQIFNEIDQEDPVTKCARYGWEYNPRQNAVPRRIFFGSLIADDSLDTIKIHATEAYDIYHSMSFVESNLTQSSTPRPLLYTDGSPRLAFLQSGIFGSSTSVYMDFFFNGTLEFSPLLRERIQREVIIMRWKASGMKPHDIGIIADIDETFSRDVLRAVQVCDVPTLRPNQDCHEPKLVAETLIFESSPECIQKGRRWVHPDLILGECILGIANSSGHPAAVRQVGDMGLRAIGYGRKGPRDYWRIDNSTGKYPLWNAADFRETDGGPYIEWKGLREQGGPAAYVTGFHFHNFFHDLRTMRNKYHTYGHAMANAMSQPLGKMWPDIDVMVRCVHGMEPSNTSLIRGFLGGYEDIHGPKPIFFQNETYRLLRHAAVRRMVLEDEGVHGPSYPREAESEETYVRHW